MREESPFTPSCLAGYSCRMNDELRQLRSEIKRRRAELTPQQIEKNSRRIADLFWNTVPLWRASAIGIYMPAFGEVDCGFFMHQARTRKKRIFAPILRKKRLLYAPLHEGAGLTKNVFGILEPVHRNVDLLRPGQLDAVIVPRVAFDTQLNRVGRGAGYYDRSFALRLRRRIWRKPLLIGVAYSFQRVPALQAAAWDVPLDVVITEKESYGSY